MIEVGNEFLVDIEDEGLDIAPSMDNDAVPDWSGALWVGAVDLDALSGHTHLRLQDSLGYHRARLLVRSGSSVRGFVDVDAPGGMVDRGDLESATATLPAAVAQRESATPSITVIVCTRDRTSLLRGAIAAILRLDYPDFDVIIVDNAANADQTRDLVRAEFRDSRLTVISEPRPGLSRARNAGLYRARGDIVAFTDDDVVVDKYWLRGIAAGFEQAEDVACVTGLVPAGELRSPAQSYFDERVNWSKIVAPKVFSMATPPKDLPTFPFCPGAFGTGANFALDRRSALALGAFDPALGVGTRTGGGEDIDMFTRVIIEGHALVVQPSAIVWHRHRAELDDLMVQARGYGKGLGSWLTKILLNPRTARLAVARSRHGALHFLKNARNHSVGQSTATAPAQASQDPRIAKVLRAELVSVGRGPLNYLLERRSGQT